MYPCRAEICKPLLVYLEPSSLETEDFRDVMFWERVCCREGAAALPALPKRYRPHRLLWGLVSWGWSAQLGFRLDV